MWADGIYVAGYGSWLPAALDAADAISAGQVDAAYIGKQRVTSVTVAEEAGPRLAVLAARAALERAAPYVDEIDLLLHSALYYQGHDMWAPASYVKRYTVNNQCPAIDVRQTSNGGMASLAMASRYLAGLPNGHGAVLTAGDRFCSPGIDRWRSDPGTVFADGGAALVIARGRGFARLRALAIIGDSELEGMHRGDDPWSPAPLTVREPLDVRLTTHAFLRRAGRSFVAGRMAAGQELAVKTALHEADVTLAEIDRFVLPNFGWQRMKSAFFGPLGIDPEKSTWEWGRGIGHLGAGDQFAGLAHLLQTGELHPGQLCALLGVGGGFSWSCAIVEMLAEPPG